MRSRLDDIEDDSTLRRGKPVAYIVFGRAQTVNSATYLLAKATRDVEQLKHPACKAAFLGMSSELFYVLRVTYISRNLSSPL
jgi:geranylgeranyl pyrophosphate synthase